MAEPAAVQQVSDSKGDVLAYPKAALSLPFSDSGNTFFFNDDYHVACQGDYYDTQGGKVGVEVADMSQRCNTRCACGKGQFTSQHTTSSANTQSACTFLVLCALLRSGVNRRLGATDLTPADIHAGRHYTCS